jgi:hypothetical protein
MVFKELLILRSFDILSIFTNAYKTIEGNTVIN